MTVDLGKHTQTSEKQQNLPTSHQCRLSFCTETEVNAPSMCSHQNYRENKWHHNYHLSKLCGQIKHAIIKKKSYFTLQKVFATIPTSHHTAKSYNSQGYIAHLCFVLMGDRCSATQKPENRNRVLRKRSGLQAASFHASINNCADHAAQSLSSCLQHTHLHAFHASTPVSAQPSHFFSLTPHPFLPWNFSLFIPLILAPFSMLLAPFLDCSPHFLSHHSEAPFTPGMWPLVKSALNTNSWMHV